jgi:hypothetical protein
LRSTPAESAPLGRNHKSVGTRNRKRVATKHTQDST